MANEEVERTQTNTDIKLGWDQYFLDMLPLIAARSKDPNTKVGCVIVGPDNEIRSTGYNSFVRGLDDTKPERHVRPEKYLWIEHADRNAIYNAARIGVSTKGCRMYLPFLPCVDCARGIVSAGIAEVVIGKVTYEERLSKDTYANDREPVITMFKECGVGLRFA